MKLTIETQNLNWLTLWIIVGTVLTTWSALATIIPDPYYRVVTTILAAVQSGFTFALRAGKYVTERKEVPPEGVKP